MIGYILWTLLIVGALAAAIACIASAMNLWTANERLPHWRVVVALLIVAGVVCFSVGMGSMMYAVHHHDCARYGDC